jgi:hypothetical protein
MAPCTAALNAVESSCPLDSDSESVTGPASVFCEVLAAPSPGVVLGGGRDRGRLLGGYGRLATRSPLLAPVGAESAHRPSWARSRATSLAVDSVSRSPPASSLSSWALVGAEPGRGCSDAQRDLTEAKRSSRAAMT